MVLSEHTGVHVYVVYVVYVNHIHNQQYNALHVLKHNTTIIIAIGIPNSLTRGECGEVGSYTQ